MDVYMYSCLLHETSIKGEHEKKTVRLWSLESGRLRVLRLLNPTQRHLMQLKFILYTSVSFLTLQPLSWNLHRSRLEPLTLRNSAVLWNLL